jgi:hypothetical protein
VLAFACALLIQPALGATLYGTVGEDTASTLVEINPTTGALVRTIGSVGYAVNGMVSGRDGTLYATTTGNDNTCPRALLRINLTTGAGTPIGPCGAAGGGDRPALLTASASGQLYSWYEPSSDDLITWNKVAGTYSAPIGDAGLGTGGHTLAFDVAGTTLYLLQNDDLYTINPTTGASTSLGSVSGVTESPNHGDFNPDDNLLYAISEFGGGNPRSLLVINVATMTQVRSVATVDNLHTLAFFGPPPAATRPVPVDNAWALAAAALLLAAFGAYYVKRT